MLLLRKKNPAFIPCFYTMLDSFNALRQKKCFSRPGFEPTTA